MTKKEKQTTYVERDVSWMYFNHRILQEAEKPNVPLLERLSFLGIYSNNLDEFFRVRVASLNRLVDNESLPERHRKTIRKTLKTINRLNEEYSNEYTKVTRKVAAELEEHHVRLLNETQLNEEQKQFLKNFYYDRLNGSTNPIWLSAIDDLNTLEDNRIYLVVKKMHRDDDHKVKYAIIKVPDRVYGRFIKIPSSDGFDNIMYLDDVIRFCLPLIFIGTKPSDYEAYSFKFTKDAEMEMDNLSDYGAMEKIALGVDSRKRGVAIRVIYDKDMPREMQKRVFDRLNVRELDTALAGGRYQNHRDLMSFPNCGHSELLHTRAIPFVRRLHTSAARGCITPQREGDKDHALSSGERLEGGEGAHLRRTQRQEGDGCGRADGALRRGEQHQVEQAYAGGGRQRDFWRGRSEDSL